MLVFLARCTGLFLAKKPQQFLAIKQARSNGLHVDQGQKDGISYIDQKASIQWIQIRLYKSLAATSKEQVFDKGIRQKSTKRVNSFTVCCVDCSEPPSRGRLDSEKEMRVCTSSGFMLRHEWRVDKSKIRMRVKTLSNRRHKFILRV